MYDALYVRPSPISPPPIYLFPSLHVLHLPSSGCSNAKPGIVPPKHTTRFYASLLRTECFPHLLHPGNCSAFNAQLDISSFRKLFWPYLHNFPSVRWAPKSLCISLSLYILCKHKIAYFMLFTCISPLPNSGSLEINTWSHKHSSLHYV